MEDEEQSGARGLPSHETSAPVDLHDVIQGCVVFGETCWLEDLSDPS
jgi:hypothetical protein